MFICKNLAYQSYGSSILLYSQSQTEQDAYNVWLSLFNWGAVGTTGSEPEWVGEFTIASWSTVKKLKHYLFNRYLMAILNNESAKYKGVPGGAASEARRLAEEDFAQIGYDTYRSVNSTPDFHDIGTITAEKPDLSLEDSIVEHAYKS